MRSVEAREVSGPREECLEDGHSLTRVEPGRGLQTTGLVGLIVLTFVLLP